MIKKTLLGVALLLGCAVQVSTFSVNSIASNVSAADRTFISTYDLPGPPLRGGSEDIADYQQVMHLQNTRTPSECARAASEESISLASFYGPPYGPLTTTEVSKWKSLIQKLNLPAYAVVGLAKTKYRRPRPFKSHADVKPCIQLASGTSYPSGHSALAQFDARVLALAFPARREALMIRAREIAFDRSLGGVHYPTDIRDGNLLGDQIFENQNRNGALEKLVRLNAN